MTLLMQQGHSFTIRLYQNRQASLTDSKGFGWPEAIAKDTKCHEVGLVLKSCGREANHLTPQPICEYTQTCILII